MSDDLFAKFVAAGVLSVVALATMPLMAETAAETPEKIIADIVGDATLNDDGLMAPSTGMAEPTENWFGCKPSEGEQAEACDAGDKRDSEEAG